MGRESNMADAELSAVRKVSLPHRQPFGYHLRSESPFRVISPHPGASIRDNPWSGARLRFLALELELHVHKEVLYGIECIVFKGQDLHVRYNVHVFVRNKVKADNE